MRWMIAYWCIFVGLSSSAHTSDEYLLSSEPLVQEEHSSLKGYGAFTFCPLLHMKREAQEGLLALMKQELQKVGTVEIKQFFTPLGLDFSAMPLNFLTFTLEQLVDQNNVHLPIIRASLSTSTSIKILNNHETSILNTNEWATYVKKDSLKQTIQKTLPGLLRQFIMQYQKDNPNNPKPTFCIINTPTN